MEVSEIDGIRSLYLGSITVQSSMKVSAPNELLLPYSRAMMLFLLFLKERLDILILGLGGGSIPKFIRTHLPECKTRVVEINPEVVKVARSHFYLPDNDDFLQVVEEDGARYLKEHPGNTDVLMLDIFDAHGIPPNLYAQDFFDSCFEALNSDGMMAVNLWGSDKNFDIYLQRIEISFNRRVLVIKTGKPGNIVVLGFKHPPAELRWEPIREKAKTLDEKYKLGFMLLLDRVRESNPHTNNRIVMD